MKEFYDLKICGITRPLPKVRIAPGLSIASFVMLGDTTLVEKCADALAAKLKTLGAVDLLVCPEAKGIPLTHAIAVRLGVDYIVARKSVKSYMEEPLTSEVKSITTAGTQMTVIDGADAKRLAGKRVCVVDDVVSTGGSLIALESLLARTGCTVVTKVAALLEEGGYDGHDLVYLEKLPIFKD